MLSQKLSRKKGKKKKTEGKGDEMWQEEIHFLEFYLWTILSLFVFIQNEKWSIRKDEWTGRN